MSCLATLILIVDIDVFFYSLGRGESDEGSFFGDSPVRESYREAHQITAAGVDIGGDSNSSSPTFKTDGFISSSGKGLGAKYGNLQVDKARLAAFGAPPTTGTYYGTPPAAPPAIPDGGDASSAPPVPSAYPTAPNPYSRGRYVAYDAINNAAGPALVPGVGAPPTAVRRDSSGDRRVPSPIKVMTFNTPSSDMEVMPHL